MAGEGCARVTGTVGSSPSEAVSGDSVHQEETMTARVGRSAPDFTAPAYREGAFTSISLSDYAGRWVLLCFYPGDFTFV